MRYFVHLVIDVVVELLVELVLNLLLQVLLEVLLLMRPLLVEEARIWSGVGLLNHQVLSLSRIHGNHVTKLELRLCKVLLW